MNKRMNSRSTFCFLVVLLAVPFLAVAEPATKLPMIGVVRFESTVDSRDWNDYLNAKPQNLERMIETQLAKTGKFSVYERNRLDKILAEQGIQSHFNGTKVSVSGLDYVLYGSITEFNSTRSDVNAGGMLLADVTTTLGVDVRVTSILTGEIRRAENIKVIEKTAHAMQTREFSISDNRIASYEQIQRKMARRIAAFLAESVFPITVISTDGVSAILNYGDAILSKSDILNIYEVGKAIVDPATKKELGQEEKLVATIKIVEVKGEYSEAVKVTGGVLQAGMRARLNVRDVSGQGLEQRKEFGGKL